VLDEEIEILEDQISSLVELCKKLREENNSLKVGKKGLTEDNVRLGEKNRLARTKIESIIGKLKALEPQ